MSEGNKIYVTNVTISMISPTRLAGEGRMKELLGIDKIPATMRPLLAQEVIDRKILNPIGTLKKSVRTALLLHGSREPLLGWVIDPDRVGELSEILEAKEQQFPRLKSQLLSGYAVSCEQHLAKLRKKCAKSGLSDDKTKALLEVVRSSQPTRDYLDQQITFRWLRPRPVELIDEEFRMVTNSLFDVAIRDIEQRARETVSATRHSTRIKALEEIRQKLTGLAYLDARYRRIADEIGQLLAGLPVASPDKEWTATAMFALSGAIQLLADGQRLVERVRDDKTLFDVPDTPISPEPATTAEMFEPAQCQAGAMLATAPVCQQELMDSMRQEVTESSALVPESEPQPAANTLSSLVVPANW